MKKWSKTWKASKSPRKQRKYRRNAAIHIKRKFLSAHLSKELREKYKKRNLELRKGDKIEVMRGQFKGKKGRVDKVSVKKEKAYIDAVKIEKRDGTKVYYPIHASNLMITQPNLEDKKRVASLKREMGGEKK